jgi:hypothetical protein
LEEIRETGEENTDISKIIEAKIKGQIEEQEDKNDENIEEK